MTEIMETWLKDRIILHCDLNAFFASVEAVKNPELKGKPIAVCGSPEKRRGIVLAKSEEAKQCGVKTGDTIWQAQLKCPDIIIVSSHHQDYTAYSKKVRDIYYRYTDKVESFGSDECWLDVTSSRRLFGDGPKIADELREVIKRELGLTISVGVSFNKTYAKIGSDVKKPDATTVISRSNYKEIVYPMPVNSMLFVGRKTKALFEKLNIKTIGDLAEFDVQSLHQHIGITAEQLIAAACGEDNSPVNDYSYQRVVKSVGNGTTTSRDIKTFREAEHVIYTLSEEVAYRLRQKGLKGRTVSLSVRNPQLEWVSAQQSMPDRTNSVQTILKNALIIFRKLWNAQGRSGDDAVSPIRSMRIAVSNLTADTRIQLSLLEDGQTEERFDKLSAVFDKIRRKHGTSSLRYGTQIEDIDFQFEVLDE